MNNKMSNWFARLSATAQREYSILIVNMLPISAVLVSGTKLKSVIRNTDFDNKSKH